ncbi:hypothetical protein ACC691_41445, partial [Rhizobium johnstonii]|uniref:hypothetical protein n=1 Tax=Rhizobium johnstonii TaxID=3019933 RepID=UPI003F9B12B0
PPSEAYEAAAHVSPHGAGKHLATGLDLIFERLDESITAQAQANRSQARLWAALAELMRLARANPHVYLRPTGLAHRD